MLGALRPAGAGSDEKPRQHKPDPAVHKRGAEIYATACAACHGQDGLGVAGAFPPLAGSEWANQDSSRLIRIVLHGLQGPIKVGGKDFNGVMPPPANLSDRDIGDVLTYVRQSFGNDSAPVSDAEVKAVRGRFPGPRAMWTAEELQRTAP